jgi:hypothetical protein
MKNSLNSTTKMGKVLHLIILFAIRNVQNCRFDIYFYVIRAARFSIISR